MNRTFLINAIGTNILTNQFNLKCPKMSQISPVLSQTSSSDLVSSVAYVVIRQIGRPLYTHTTDELMADFHCLGLNKVLKSRGNPVGLKSLP